MGMIERLQFIITANGADAVKEFNKLGSAAGTELGKAETATGKFGAATTFAKGHALELAAAGGAALVAFAAKGVAAFNDLAITSGKFSDATGVGVEDASRWIAVADDVGVSAEAVQGAMLKLVKAGQDGGKTYATYGVELAKTASGQTDVNGTMLNAVEALNKITDPIKRNEAAQKLFGKSFAEVSELVFSDATKLKEALEGVSDAQVIDDSELEKARAYRAAMDDLQDAVGDLAMSVGEELTPAITALVPVMTAAASAIGPTVGKIMDLNSAVAEFITGTDPFAEGTHHVAEAMVMFEGRLITVAEKEKLAAKAAEELSDAQEETAEAAANASDAMDRAKNAAANLKNAYAILSGEISSQQAWRALEDTFTDVEAAGVAAFEAAQSGATDAAEKTRAYEDEVLDLKQEIIDYGATILNLPPERVSKILADIDRGALDSVEAELQDLARTRTAIIETAREDRRGTGGTPTPPSGRPPAGGRAQGGPTAAGSMYEILERGESEVLNEGGRSFLLAGANGNVVPLPAGGSTGGTAGVVIHAPVTVQAGFGADGNQIGRQITEHLRQFVRLNGSASVSFLKAG